MVSGELLEDYFRQHILAPLGMNDTSYNVPEAKGPRLVAQQWRGGERMDGAIELQKPQLGLTIASPIGGGGLASTAEDYGRFVRMLLNGGALDGARVLKAETVALMGQNHIGAVTVPAHKSALPRSADFTFIADGRDKWGLGFLITADQVPGKRSPGSLSWAGINNTYFWIDPISGIAGVIMMQYLPFADAKALAVLRRVRARHLSAGEDRAVSRGTYRPGRSRRRRGLFCWRPCCHTRIMRRVGDVVAFGITLLSTRRNGSCTVMDNFGRPPNSSRPAYGLTARLFAWVAKTGAHGAWSRPHGISGTMATGAITVCRGRSADPRRGHLPAARRMTHRPPPMSSDIPAVQRLAAHSVHWALYALLIIQPIVGWIATSASSGAGTLLWPVRDAADLVGTAPCPSGCSSSISEIGPVWNCG